MNVIAHQIGYYLAAKLKPKGVAYGSPEFEQESRLVEERLRKAAKLPEGAWIYEVPPDEQQMMLLELKRMHQELVEEQSS